jgi:hypothetical protein
LEEEKNLKIEWMCWSVWLPACWPDQLPVRPPMQPGQTWISRQRTHLSAGSTYSLRPIESVVGKACPPHKHVSRATLSMGRRVYYGGIFPFLSVSLTDASSSSSSPVLSQSLSWPWRRNKEKEARSLSLGLSLGQGARVLSVRPSS